MNFKLINEQLKNDGVSLLRNLIKSEDINLVRDAIKFAYENPSPFGKKIKNGEAVFFHDFWTYKRNKNIGKILGLKSFQETLVNLNFDIDKLRFFHDHILYKSPGAEATPWHQDRPYYLVDGPDNFSIWITPDSIHEDHSLAFIPGSHLITNEFVPVSFENSKMMGNYEGLLELKDSDISKLSINGLKIFRMQPGDAIIFNNKTLHKSLASSSTEVRTALSLRFVTENSWLTKKYVNATPPFHKMGLQYVEGEKCCEKWFPKYNSLIG